MVDGEYIWNIPIHPPNIRGWLTAEMVKMLHASWEICKYACFLKHFGNKSWLLGWNIHFHMRLLSVRQLSMRASAIFLAFVEIQFARPPAISSGSLWQRTTSDGEEKGTPTQWFSAITFSLQFTVFACSVVFQWPRLCPWGIGGMDERESLVHPHAPKDSFAIWWRTMWTAVEGKNGAKSNVVYPLVIKHGFRITFE